MNHLVHWNVPREGYHGFFVLRDASYQPLRICSGDILASADKHADSHADSSMVDKKHG